MTKDTQEALKAPVFASETRERLAALIDRSIAEHEEEFPCLPLFRAGMREVRRIVLGADVDNTVDVTDDSGLDGFFEAAEAGIWDDVPLYAQPGWHATGDLRSVWRTDAAGDTYYLELQGPDEADHQPEAGWYLSGPAWPDGVYLGVGRAEDAEKRADAKIDGLAQGAPGGGRQHPDVDAAAEPDAAVGGAL